MDFEVLDYHFGETHVNLNLWQRFQLWLLGYAKLFTRAKEGWRGPLPFYIVRCEQHGYYIDYPHGWRRYFLCPKCLEEREKDWMS